MGNDLLIHTLKRFLDESQIKKSFDLSQFFNVMESAFQKSGFRDERNDNEQLNILVIRLDAIGDNVLNSGFLRELRRNYPSARITLVVNPVVYQLVELCPYVNEIVTISSTNNLFQWLPEAINLCDEKLWRHHFDICFVPRWDIDYYFALFLSYLSGAKERISYSINLYPGKAQANAVFQLFLTKSIVNPQNIIHEADRNFYVLKACGLTVQNTGIEVWYNHADVMKAQAMLSNFANGRKLVAIVNGGNEPARIYPKELFIQALNLIKQKNDCCFVYLGVKDYFETGEFLRSGMNGGGH